MPASVLFTCPFCNTTTDVGADLAGQRGPCRQCGQLVEIPTLPGQTARRAASGAATTVMVLRAFGFGAVFAGMVTGILVTFPEMGSLLGAVAATVAPTEDDEDYRLFLVGQLSIWGGVTFGGGFLAACLVGVIASLGYDWPTLHAKCRSAAGGALAGAGITFVCFLIPRWVLYTTFTPQVLFIQLAVVLLAGLLGGIVGAWRGRYV